MADLFADVLPQLQTWPDVLRAALTALTGGSGLVGFYALVKWLVNRRDKKERQKRADMLEDEETTIERANRELVEKRKENHDLRDILNSVVLRMTLYERNDAALRERVAELEFVLKQRGLKFREIPMPPPLPPMPDLLQRRTQQSDGSGTSGSHQPLPPQTGGEL